MLCVDVDDTILEFTRPFQNWVRTKGYEFERCIRQMKTGATIDTLLGTDRETTDELIREFTLQTDDFADLPAEPDAVKVLPELHKAGYEFVAITATFDTEENRRRRAANLKKAFGFEFAAVHLTGLGGSKRSFLEMYQPTVFVEDNFGHAVAGHEVGHTSYLLDRSYTRGLEHEGVRRVKNWYAIAADLLGDQ
jgi:FMN phosphatase YigB (HAD superfamily)